MSVNDLGETESIYAYAQEPDAPEDDEPPLPENRSWKIPVVAALAALAAVTGVGYALTMPSPAPVVVAQPIQAPIASAASIPTVIDAAPPAVQIPVQPTQAEALSPDQRFVSILKAQGFVASVSDDQIAEEGRTVCRYLGDGTNFNQLVTQTAQASGIEESHARRFDMTAADILCPQYSPK